ncbi:MAG TPA: HNH endonuclease signature motif containing protein [Gemmatimonadaceae bacterium]|nr:HNH endonuclease signature motif containing protein [Gemmatimonadaceae bacterium]
MRNSPKRRPVHGRTTHLTSQPTGRGAYTETRAWLLKQHGPICAYCGRKGSARGMTLDHVTPRRGQIAYDRRDNLVLACKLCNAAKADTPLLAFLLADRTRAARLLKYGDHLSNGLIDLAEELAGPLGGYSAAIRTDDESPYRD